MSFDLQTATLAELEDRLTEIARPKGFRPTEMRLREAWDANRPELLAEHMAISTRLDVLDREAQAAHAAETEAARVERGLEESGAGQRNRLALTSLRPAVASEAAEAFMHDERTFLVLLGGVGVGKSVAATLAIQRAVQGGRAAYFFRAVEGSTLSLFDAEDKAAVRRMRSTGLLVIDDVGMESTHDTWRLLLEDVLDARYQERRKTVLTSNLDWPAFRKKYGERIADRLRHDGRVVACGAASLRERPK